MRYRIKQTRVLFSYSILSLLLLGCGGNRNSVNDAGLQTISLIDRNGITETVNNPERIKQYRAVNFLNPQPYQKVYRIHKRDQAGNIPAYLHSYHENGQIKQYLEVKNSRALGAYKEWHQNGVQKTQAYVIGGEADLSLAAENEWIFDGFSYAWDEEGRLLAEIFYRKGELQGDSIYYHTNGSIWKKIPFCDNQVHGSLEVFLDNGQLFQHTEYVKGRLDGTSTRYWPDTSILALQEEYLNNNLLNGCYFDRNGSMISEVKDGNGFKAVFGKTELAELHEYRNGIPEGEVKIFGTDKKLLRKFQVKDGNQHGEEIEYYDIPNRRHIPRILVTWYEGKIQGISKSWYDNGVQESNRELSNNAKNGIATAWYRNGNLMLIEEYEHDKLLKGEYYRKADQYPVSVIKDGKGTATLFDPEGNFLRKIYYDNGTPSGTS